MSNSTKLIISFSLALWVLFVALYSGFVIGEHNSRRAPDAVRHRSDPNLPQTAPRLSSESPSIKTEDPTHQSFASLPSERSAEEPSIPLRDLRLDDITLPEPPRLDAPALKEPASKTQHAEQENSQAAHEGSPTLSPHPQGPKAENPPSAEIPAAPSRTPVRATAEAPSPHRPAPQVATAGTEHPSPAEAPPVRAPSPSPTGPRGTCVFDIKAFEFSGENNFGYRVECYVYQIRLESLDAPRYVDFKEFGPGVTNYDVATFRDVPVPDSKSYTFLCTIKYKACYAIGAERYFTKTRQIKTYARDNGKWITEMDLLQSWEIPAP
jgi:hypothetical protein